MTIIQAQVEHAAIIEDLAKRIWPIAYKNVISAEQIEYMLKWMYSRETVEKEIQEGYVYYLAELDGEFVGYAGISILDEKDVKLHKLYRLPDLKCKGIGYHLLNTCIAQAKAWNREYLILNVNKYNAAVKFYLRNKFAIRKEIVLDIGEGFVMDDYIMEIKL